MVQEAGDDDEDTNVVLTREVAFVGNHGKCGLPGDFSFKAFGVFFFPKKIGDTGQMASLHLKFIIPP